MKARQKFDELLSIFYENRHLDYVPLETTHFGKIMEKGNISSTELGVLLNKLNSDKYLIRVINEFGLPEGRTLGYMISAEGIEFFEDGGYKKKKIMDRIEKILPFIKLFR
jgi:hypothetical protein